MNTKISGHAIGMVINGSSSNLDDFAIISLDGYLVTFEWHCYHKCHIMLQIPKYGRFRCPVNIIMVWYKFVVVINAVCEVQWIKIIS